MSEKPTIPLYQNQTVMNVLWGEQFEILLEKTRQRGYEQAMKELEEDDRLSAKELGKRLHIDPKTINRMANTDPNFPFTPVGKNDKRYSYRKVVKYLDSKNKMV